jgi:hypothetical protein
MKANLLKLKNDKVKIQVQASIIDVLVTEPSLPYWKAKVVLNRVARDFNEEILYEGLQKEIERFIENFDKSDSKTFETSE